MTALLYGISDAGAVAADEPRLHAVSGGGLVAVLGPREAAAVLPEAAELEAHARVVGALMARAPLLPARYGTRLGDAEAARLLEERGPELREALERVRGAVELAVTVWDEDGGQAAADAGSAGPGTAYLRARLHARERRRRLLSHLEPLERCARASRVPASSGPPEALRVAYLVDAAQVDPFVTAVRALDEAGLRILCTGPWPPYSFSGGWSS